MTQHDLSFRFIIEQTNVRGEIVHLDRSWQAALKRHDYPPTIQKLLGEAMTATVLLASTLKYESSLTLQIQSKGSLSLLVVQVSSDLTFRGTAKWKENTLSSSLTELCEEGILTITVEPKNDKERYQSIININHDTLSETIESYFQQSEQLDTRLWLTADDNKTAGMLIQKLPDQSTIPHGDTDTWNRVEQLASTITDAELLSLSSEKILHRLFNQESVRLFKPKTIHFFCSCSKTRITNMLRGMSYDEIQSILKDDGMVEINCGFCSKHYAFDTVDIEEVFASENPPSDPSSIKH